MESSDELISRLAQLTEPGAREKILARGLARGMIWADGQLPPDSPAFAHSLTNDLLNHGYTILGCALRLRSVQPDARILDRSFRAAATSIEAAVRRGTINNDRGFHLTMAAASYHLGHYAARAFSLLAEDQASLNLSSVEKLLVDLMQRRLGLLESRCRDWLQSEVNTDSGIANQLVDEQNNFCASDASQLAVRRVFHRAIARFDFALRTGESGFADSAVDLLNDCINATEQLRHVPMWWSSILARHLIEDLWDKSLHNRLPNEPSDGGRWQELRTNFIDIVMQRKIAEVDLWPSQLAAATRVVDENDSLVVALPTSSGKTRIAELCILKCLAGGRRVIYVTPLRALSAQVEVTLGRTFRPLGFSVTSVYGASGLGASDVDTMQSANIVVATPEKLDFAIRQSAEVIDDVGLVVLDEGHMIGLDEREIRYEILVQRLLRRSDSENRRIVCLSAIFTEGDPFDAFTQWIRQDNEGIALRSKWRPTRQRPATLEWQTTAARLNYTVANEQVFVPRFIESEEPTGTRTLSFPKNRQELIVAAMRTFCADGHSVLVYCPLRSSVESVAKAYLKAIAQGYVESQLSEEAEEEIQAALRIGSEWIGDEHVAVRALHQGIAVHHGQLPRPFLGEIERLLRRRVLTAAVSSPTLAQGVDLSFSVLIFNSLWRSQKVIPAKEFANVIGRVGRAYVDIDGIYVLPVYETVRRTKTNRVREFHKLVRDARARQLESGLYLLIKLFIQIVEIKLGLQGSELTEYVLNQQAAIDEQATQEDDDSQRLGVALAELDAGLLALVESLDCDVTEVATHIDQALAHSYWQRRLAVRDVSEIEAQHAIIHGRASHIWNQTTPAQRKVFYEASIGTKSGLTILEHADTLLTLLAQAAVSIEDADLTALADSCTEIAAILFQVYPFQPSSFPGNWRDCLKAWITGLALSTMTDSDGIAFVQDALVFRLVWAIEAARIVLSSTPDGEFVSDESTAIAVCMTHGVPALSAARLLESGMESRLFAVRLASELELTFSTREEMLSWLEDHYDSEPIPCSVDELAVWKRFVADNEPDSQAWHRTQTNVDFQLSDERTVTVEDRVRILSDGEGGGVVMTPEFELVGSIDGGLPSNKSLVGEVVSDSEVKVNQFGPPIIPEWLENYLE